MRAALARGHQVAALVRSGSAPFHDTAIVRIDGDLAQPDWRAIEFFAPDACLHAAWIATPGEYLHSPLNAQFLDWSLAFLRGVAERGASHFAICGSCAEYAPQWEPMCEDTSPVAPATPYAQCKDALRRALEAGGLDVAWARIFHPYGPGEDPRRLATSILQRLSNRQTIMLKTPDSTRDYIFIDDVAAALLTTIERRFCGIVNVGTGIGLKVREIAETLARLLGESAQFDLSETVPDPCPRLVADAARLCSLGWSPRTSLDEGLRRLIGTLSL